MRLFSEWSMSRKVTRVMHQSHCVTVVLHGHVVHDAVDGIIYQAEVCALNTIGRSDPMILGGSPEHRVCITINDDSLPLNGSTS
jgi:hypothetical protein